MNANRPVPPNRPLWQPQPHPLPPRPGNQRKALFTHGAVAVAALIFGLVIGTGAEQDRTEKAAAVSEPTVTVTAEPKQAKADAAPAPTVTATVTATETVTEKPEPAPTVKVTVTVTETIRSGGSYSGSSGGSGGSGGSSVYYDNCSAARAAGAAPVYRGEPGYGRHLDRDGDGVGCE